MLIARKGNGTEICARCGKCLNGAKGLITDDHYIPKSLGFEQALRERGLENHVGLCQSCNQSKSDDVVTPDWYVYLSSEQQRLLNDTFIKASILQGKKYSKQLLLFRCYDSIVKKYDELCNVLEV